MNTTLTRNEDSGAHAVLPDPDATMAVWDPADDDLSYGRHVIGSRSVFPQDELTVSAILNRRTPDEILTTYRHTRSMREETPDRVPASELVARLANERMGAKEEVLTKVLGPRRPPAYTQTWWERDSTPVPGVHIGPYRPDRKQHHDPDATVGFVPLPDFEPQVTEEGNGPDERAYWDDGDPEPVSYDEYGKPGFRYGARGSGWEREIPAQTAIGAFAPIDTRVKKIPWYKQIYHGLFTKKGPQDL